MPEKVSNISDYKEKLTNANRRLEQFKQNLKLKYPNPEENSDLESSDNNF
jgi:hypothetical protein